MIRNQSFDGLKFIMIFLVVLGHISFYDYGFGVTKIIYSFHMPVFVFLSGYFTSWNKTNSDQNKWIKKTILIYAFAQLAHALISPFIGWNVSWKNLFIPDFALWYIVCLLYWRIAFWKIFLKWNDIHLFLFSLTLAIISGFVPIDYEFSFQRAFAFFPFFALGLSAKKRNLVNQINKIPLFYAIIGLCIGFVIVHNFPWGYLPTKHYNFRPEPIIRCIQTIIAIYLCLIFIRISRNKFIEKLAYFGQYTLWIYIGHTYIIKIGIYLLNMYNYTLSLIQAVMLAIAYCVLFIWIAQKYANLRKKAS